MSWYINLYFSFKKLVPVTIKKIPWYIFKSPQRKAGYKTLWFELKGIIFLGIRYIYFWIGAPELKTVSICTGLKNRSHNYLDYVVESLSEIRHPELVELSVFDCSSDDISNLEAAIRKKWKGSLVFANENIPFSRAYSFNRAVEQSTHSIIFICDADMWLPYNLVELCNKYVAAKNVWFPVCFHLKQNSARIISEANGEWYPFGIGMFASKKTDFIKIGKLNESFVSWGGEDWELWLRYYKSGFFPFRNKQKGLFHHYHPSLKPKRNNSD